MNTQVQTAQSPCVHYPPHHPIAGLNVDPLVLANRARVSATLMHEILETHETLGAVVDDWGKQVLMDLFYLHDAILTGHAIDVIEGDNEGAKVIDFLQTLPSRKVWQTYVRQMDE